MNKMMFRTMLLAGAVCFSGFLAPAQVPGGVNSAIIKLFGDTQTFSANATVQVFSNRTEWLRMPMKFTALDGKLRLDVDMAQMKSPALSASTLRMEKQLNIEQVISVTRLDRKVTYMMYPGVQGYVSMPLTDEDTQLAREKLVRTRLGHEKIEGHPCVKNRSVVKTAEGRTLLEATTWNATDLQDFPLEIETRENGNISVMRFGQPSFTRPDPKLFEPPAGYQQYPSREDLITAAAKRAAARNQKK